MAKPNLALIPAAQGTKLYSVLPSDGSGDFDFTRSSSATRINSQGLIESVTNNSSRLNYPLLDGKVVGCPHHLLEPQRTNLVSYSEDFSNSYWSKGNSSITSDSIISPDGSLNGDKLTADSSNSTHYIDTSSISFTSGVSYTVSIFVKDNNKNLVIQGSGSVTANAFASFDLKDGFIINESVGTATIKSFGNSWYKCSLTFTSAATTSGVITFLMGETRNDSYQGDGASGIYIYGAQIEAGSYPTSYIKTSGSATTRLAETASGSGSAATFNDSEGVLMAEISALADNDSGRFISLSDGSNNNRILIGYLGSNNTLRSEIYVGGGSAQATLDLNLNSQKTNIKTALKYKQNDFSLFVNGFEVAIDTNGNTFPNGVLNQLDFDSALLSQQPFYGNVKQIQYFDTTDIDLEELTSWDSFSDMANGQLYTIE